ncbi:MAG: hypothetical protein CTY18_09500 [Methylomonas sp.]|nr:MAG: hypothetical protein CTY18_09500 [Methylomonas sp.]
MGYVDKVRQIRGFKRTPEPDREGDVILLIVAPGIVVVGEGDKRYQFRSAIDCLAQQFASSMRVSIRKSLFSYPAAEIIAVTVTQVSAEALAFICVSKAVPLKPI